MPSYLRCLFALGSCTILSFLVNFKQAFTTIILKDNFGINESIKGLIVSIPAMTQILGAFLVGIFIQQALKRIFISSAFGIITIADFLMGPSNILFLPDYSAMFFIGYALSGLGTGMIYTPMLPEIIDSVYQKTGIVEGDDENLDALIADQASGLYFSFFSLGVIKIID